MVHLNAVLIALLASIVISAFTIVVTEKMGHVRDRIGGAFLAV